MPDANEVLSMMLQVNEIFGPTIQGEGPATGRHSLFIRMFGCNLECTWCDTAYTWAVTKPKAAKTLSGKQFSKDTECHYMYPSEVLAALEKHWPWRTNPTNVVISGGEPMMQQESLFPVIAALDQADCPIHIETAGTITPSNTTAALVSQFVVSPKLANSGNHAKKRYKPDTLRWFNEHNAWFKFVIDDVKNLAEVDEMANALSIPAHRIMIMPEGTSYGIQLVRSRNMIDEILRRGYGLSMREHVLIWGNRRAH